METIGIAIGVMIVVAVAWGIWIDSHSKPFAQIQAHFAWLVDALEEGDIERAAICERLFNELSGDALHRFSLEQLVKRRYVNEQDAVRIHALHEFQADQI